MTRSDASHACDACGGSGGNHWTVRYWHGSQPVFEIRFADEATARREQDYLDRAGWGHVTCSPVEFPDPCPVCLGAGRISDQMPVADALADAETLLLNMNLGQRALYYGWPERQWDSSFYGPGAMYEFGCYLARAAFRAVPGLRGE